MIINGGSRSNWRFFSKHLVKAEENERVHVTEIRGLAAETVLEAFRELDALASGTRVKNFFYHANINPRDDEQLTPEQWERAVDTLEESLGLTGQSRFVVEHEKTGRTHRHVIWSRIDPDTLTAVSDSHNYMRHEQAARMLETLFGHEAVQGAHGRDEEIQRPPRRPDNWEKFRGHGTGIDPEAVKAELTALWRQADSGQAFAAALGERGYLLARGDRRDFCVVDAAGDNHSLARRIEGVRAKDIRARMADVDRDALPSVAEAREQFKMRPDEATPATKAMPEPAAGDSPFDRLRRDAQETMAANAGDLQPLPLSETESRDDQAPGASPFQRFVNAVKWLMYSKEGHVPQSDGLTWWERVAVVVPLVSYIAEKTAEAVTGYWQNFVDRHSSRGDSGGDRDHSPDLDR